MAVDWLLVWCRAFPISSQDTKTIASIWRVIFFCQSMLLWVYWNTRRLGCDGTATDAAWNFVLPIGLAGLSIQSSAFCQEPSQTPSRFVYQHFPSETDGDSYKRWAQVSAVEKGGQLQHINSPKFQMYINQMTCPGHFHFSCRPATDK